MGRSGRSARRYERGAPLRQEIHMCERRDGIARSQRLALATGVAAVAMAAEARVTAAVAVASEAMSRA